MAIGRSIVKVALWTVGLAVVGLAAWLVALYLMVYSRPADLFDVRDHPPEQVRAWSQEFLVRLGDAHNGIVERRTVRFTFTDSQVNSFLHHDGAALLDDRIPREFSEYQVSFKPGALVFRVRYEHPELNAVYVGIHVRAERRPGGEYHVELDDVRIGRQSVPKSLVMSRIAEALPDAEAGKGDIDLTGIGSLDEFAKSDKAKRLLLGVVQGADFGPNIAFKPFLERRSAVRKQEFRIKDLQLGEGTLTVELEPLPALIPASFELSASSR